MGMRERVRRGAAHASFLFLVLLVGMLPLAACVQTVRETGSPAYRDLRTPLTRVAVAPFRMAPLLRQRAERGDDPDVSAALVARHFSEALAQRGIDVVAPNDMRQALAPEEAEKPLPAAALAKLAADKFGADALVVGELTRFTERRGQAASAMRPASVGFRVTLYAAPQGQVLWSGAFDETQRALSENIFNVARYPGGGMRWLTGEELARWGAQETAAAMPLGR